MMRGFNSTPGRRGCSATAGYRCRDGRPEHEVQELLKFKMRWGWPYVLVRWAGHVGTTRRATHGSRSTT